MEAELLAPQDSPNGKAAVMFVGKATSTISIWEFECAELDDPAVDMFSVRTNNPPSIPRRRLSCLDVSPQIPRWRRLTYL